MFEFLGIAYSPDAWLQTLLPLEHFSGISTPQGTGPISQTSPVTPGRSGVCWVTILPASVESLEPFGEDRRWISKSQYFSQERNSYVISIFIIYKRSNETWGAQGRQRGGDHLARPRRRLRSRSGYLIRQKHTRLIPAGSYHFSFWFHWQHKAANTPVNAWEIHVKRNMGT